MNNQIKLQILLKESEELKQINSVLLYQVHLNKDRIAEIENAIVMTMGDVDAGSSDKR